jgi:ABC-type antimicrobial peptide transport system permease subunit
MILEKNTANYSLNLWGGLGEVYEYRDSFGKEFSLQTAALLDNSIFQGDLLVSEETLLEQYPETGGYRFFAIECPAEKAGDVQKVLENRLGDYGFSAETTGRRLARFLAVQNTYLSTFQSLGGLGLLFGTLGLAAVQLRNVIERRGELALLRAVGFTRRRLALLVLLENAVLLALGLASGILAATVAVMPHFLATHAPIPWLSLVGILGLVFLVGLLAGLASVRQVLNAPLLNALREER